ncbi:hypothetical protein SARU107417_00080 [Salinibacter ruber]
MLVNIPRFILSIQTYYCKTFLLKSFRKPSPNYPMSPSHQNTHHISYFTSSN